MSLDLGTVEDVRQPNPYRPGFNQAPAVLAGRDDVLAAAREALDVAALDARTPRPLVLVGSRGVGKTVLLGEVASVAGASLGWLTVSVEVRPRQPFTPQLCERLDAATELLRDTGDRGRFELASATARASVLGIGGEIGVVRRADDPAASVLTIEHSLAAAVAAALERSSGLVVTIDELQAARRAELADLAATLQQHVPDGWPLVVVAAGLPSMRDTGRSVTYLERGEWHEIGLLDHDDTVLALEGPAAEAGRPLDRDGAEVLADASGGYPYAVQVLGHHAWRRSAGSPRIRAAHCRDALDAADRDLATGLYAGRWGDASPKEREYLVAVARLVLAGDGRDGDVTGGAVAASLGATAKELSYLRDRLLKKGTLVAVGRTLRFPVPGMAAWIAER
jgi:hypothetical protein